MKKKIIYKDVELMDRKEIEAYINGYEDFMHWDDESYQYTQNDEDKLYEYINEDNNVWWEEVVVELGRLMNGKRFKVIADLGFWYGRRQSHKTCDGFEAIQACLGNSSCQAIEIYETDRGTLKVDYHHHDGTHHFTIKEVTNKGLRSTHFMKQWGY